MRRFPPVRDAEVPRPRPPRVVAVAAGVQGASMLPMFLTGALGVQLQRELGFGPGALGVATGAFILARAGASIPLGRLTDRIGATRSMRISTTGSALSLALTATLVNTWGALVAILAFAGAIQGISQPAVNRFVSRSVRAERLGLAFGVKQSGPPAAIAVAGAAVPVLGLTFGWRWAFGGATVLAVFALLSIPPRPMMAQAAPERVPTQAGDNYGGGGGGLGLVMLGMVFSLAAVNAMQTFLVDSGVAAGLQPGFAGILLSAGGVLAIVSRVLAGLRADRRGGGHLRFVARMLLAGAVGYVLLALATPATHVAGGLLAYGGVWGMNGVLFMAIVRHRPDAPAAASGNTIAVGSVGGFLGAPIFGFVAEQMSYTAAWAMTGVWAIIAAAAIAFSAAARNDPIAARISRPRPS